MEFQIKNRWSGAVQFECELEGEVAGWSYGLRLGFAVKKAIEARAVLTGAVLTGADLTGADLTPIRDDIWAVLSSAPAEVPGLLAALRDGRVDGSTYTGECACLVGTIANVRGVDFSDLQGLAPNSGRPAEVFFMGIGRGDTPETSPRAKLAAEWVEDWLTRMQMTFGGASKAVASETAVP